MSDTEVADAASKEIVIQGVKFTVPVPYAEGHPLTAPEARALNQVYHENLRNNFAKQVKNSLEGVEGALPEAQLPSAFAEYVAGYSFSTPGAGGGASRALGPVEREARALAKDLVKAHLAKTGNSFTAPKEASDEDKAAYKAKIDAKIEEVAARDEVLATAKKNVADRAKSLDKITMTLDL